MTTKASADSQVSSADGGAPGSGRLKTIMWPPQRSSSFIAYAIAAQDTAPVSESPANQASRFHNGGRGVPGSGGGSIISRIAAHLAAEQPVDPHRVAEDR